MGFIYALRSEQEKTKHTSFWAIWQMCSFL